MSLAEEYMSGRLSFDQFVDRAVSYNNPSSSEIFDNDDRSFVDIDEPIGPEE